MHNSISKKLLAGALSVMMVLSLVAPTNAQAASSYSFKQKSGLSKLTADKAYTYYVKGVKSTQYIKVARTYKDVLVKKGDTVVKKTTKVKGTGKTITLKVTAPDKVKNYKNTLKVKVYNKKTNKLVKTLKRTATIKVKELKITSVEPTTAATGNTGYKYIRVNFNKALDKISTDDIEIRAKATQQLYTVDSVKLSNGNKSADITIKGDASVAGTTFLMAGSIYTASFSQNGVTASLQFELPNYLDEQTVVAANVAKKQVKVGATWFTVPKTYTANLGELVGRTVSFGYNGDAEMSSLYVKDEKVVYASVTWNPATSSSVAYFENDETHDKYEICTTGTTSNAVTRYINAATGATTAAASVPYAKLVMNTNGTVRTAALERLGSSIVCTSVKDNTVTQDKNVALGLKDYTIVKDGKYIAASEIVKGDVVYYNATDKFADVYSKTVTGKMGTIYSSKVTVGDKTYSYNTVFGFQYYNATTELYTAADDKYLLNLDNTKEVTLTLSRDGKVRVVAGTDATTSTTGRYVITKNNAAAFTDADGAGVVIYASKDGSAEKLMARQDSYKTTGAKTPWATLAGANSLCKTEVCDITFNAKGLVVDVEKVKSLDKLTAPETVVAADTTTTGGSTTLEATDTVLKTDAANTTYSMNSSTTMWVVTETANGIDKVAKKTLGDLQGSVTANVAIGVHSGVTNGMNFIVDGSKVTDIVVYNLISTNEVKEYKAGIVMGRSIAMNADKTDYILKDLTLLTKDGSTKYFTEENTVKDYADASGNPTDVQTTQIPLYQFATIGLDKDGHIVKVAMAKASDVKSVTSSNGTWNVSSFVDTPNGITVTPTANATIIDITDDKYEATSVTDIAANFKAGKTGTVEYHKAVGTSSAWTADVITVKYNSTTTTPSVAGTITQDAAGTTLTANIPTGKLVKSFQWYQDGDASASGMGNSKTQTITAMATYSCVLTFSDGTTSTLSYKPTQVATEIGTFNSSGVYTQVTTGGTGTVADIDASTAGPITFGGTYYVVDQFHNKMTTAGTATLTKANSDATATLTWDATGLLAGTYTNNASADTEKLTAYGATITITETP